MPSICLLFLLLPLALSSPEPGEVRQVLEEVLDKHLPNSQFESGAGLPNTQHRNEDTGGNRVGSVEHPVPLTVKYKVTQRQEQNQKKKPQKVGLWLLARKASKDGPQRNDLEAKYKNQVPSSAREGRQVHSADPGALMYLPLGGSKSVRCPTAADAAAVSIAQMTFLSTSLNILSIVANINNNLNNNNNNNNQLNINAQSNNNIVTNTNVNNGNQVNVMVPILMP